MRNGFKVLLLIAVLLVLGKLAQGCSASPGVVPAATRTTAAAASQWDYSTQADPLTDKQSHFACIHSTNKVTFQFPYQGDQSAELCFRQESKKLVAYFEIEKGQILCSVLSCKLQFRFDDGPVTSMRALESRTMETNVVFVSDAATLLAKVQRAKTARIQADYYQEGARTFEFSLPELSMGKLKD